MRSGPPIHRSLATLVLVLSLANGAPVAAAGTTRTVRETPMVGVTISVVCDGRPPRELVGRTGVLQAVTTTTIGSGRAQVTYRSFYRGFSAADPSGRVYRLSGEVGGREVVSIRPGIAETFSFRARLLVTGQGLGIVAAFHEVVRIIIGADGSVRTEVVHERFSCPDDR